MRRLAGLCAAPGLVAAGLMASAPTAQATGPAGGSGPTAEQHRSVTAYQDCPVDWFCVWEHVDGGGRMARFQTGSDNLGDFNLNDQVSSVWNRTGKLWCTWLNINRDGATWPVGNWRGNTSQYNRNDNISSLHVGAC
ncbi:peptidase inhibitor family I36 protein [Kitasatospora sp. NPDC056327]|uniref:peptidase inhibitor family I36 protein n=1 Tax=Kitasatospora sp. NPDC056327 TaxID=3345785 RepID=UPI0035DD67C4